MTEEPVLNMPFCQDTTGYHIHIKFLPQEEGIVTAVGAFNDAKGRFVAYGSGKDQEEAQADVLAKICRIKSFLNAYDCLYDFPKHVMSVCRDPSEGTVWGECSACGWTTAKYKVSDMFAFDPGPDEMQAEAKGHMTEAGDGH